MLDVKYFSRFTISEDKRKINITVTSTHIFIQEDGWGIPIEISTEGFAEIVENFEKSIKKIKEITE